MPLFDDEKRTKEIVDELTLSYWMEMETVQNYLANSENLDGVRAEEVKKALAEDVAEELGHAQQLARRIRVLGGRIPGSEGFRAVQKSLQPPAESTDVKTVIKGVIEAEDGAIKQYRKIIKLTDGYDYATQDMCITLMENEENHRREFVGFLKGFEG